MASMPASELLSGGHQVARRLAAAGVPAIACVPGESFLGLLDALAATPGLPPVIGCRHEHAAVMLAEAAGKLSGRPAVCLVTRGPGACNAAIGVHTAFQDQTPLLLIVGQVARCHLGREAFQEVDLVAMVRPLAKHAEQVERAGDLPAAVDRALWTAVTGRPGPVVLAVPEDVFRETAAMQAPAVSTVASPVLPEPGQMERLHRILGDAERPLLILGGGGWTDAARGDIARFIRDNGLPVSVGFRRLDLFDSTDPLFVGELGLATDPALLARVRAADVVLVVGSRLGEATAQGYRLFGKAVPTLVHVYPEPREIGRVFPASLAIVADPVGFAAAAAALAPFGGARWRDWARAARDDYEADRMGPPPAGDTSRGPLDLRQAMASLDARLPADAIVTVDAGNFSGWPQRFLSFPTGRRFLGPCNGAMGYGLPAALAATLLHPGRTVVACVGDGGFGMTGQDLATAVQHGLKPLVLVFDNRMYGTIRMHQERLYPGRSVATDLGVTDFAAMARAMGAWAARVTTTAAFAPALEAALAAGRAALLHLACDARQISTRLTLDDLAAARNTADDPDADHAER